MKLTRQNDIYTILHFNWQGIKPLQIQTKFVVINKSIRISKTATVSSEPVGLLRPYSFVFVGDIFSVSCEAIFDKRWRHSVHAAIWAKDINFPIRVINIFDLGWTQTGPRTEFVHRLPVTFGKTSQITLPVLLSLGHRQSSASCFIKSYAQ